MRLALKVLMVALLTVAILLPLMMVRSTIQERQGFREAVVRDVAANFGGRQVLGGPVLVVPFTEVVEEEVGDDGGALRRVSRRRSGQWVFFPDTLTIDGELQPDTRRRGLHKVRVYQWQGGARARFDVRIPEDVPGTQPREIGRPWLSVGIADVRGLQGEPVLQMAGQALPLQQGIGHAEGPGLHARLAAPAAGGRMTLDARLQLKLRGTESFAMRPYGHHNELRLRSPWPHPKFQGMSPRHDIDEDGFRATWQVAGIATGAQQQYRRHPALATPEPSVHGRTGDAWAPAPDSASVALLDPVNPYLQADRATKYGVLFVMLTFVGFFMFELVTQLRIHPIQYALVGLALAIFFLLLVALSEHVVFGLAYVAASVACIGLIGFYLSAVLRSRARGAGFAAMLAALYAALYGLLVSEDNALVLGAGLLFAILAALMVATRRIDWYQVSARQLDPRG